MLYRENIEPRCEYCRYGSGMGYGEVACEKRGVFSASAFCAKFRYDPSKRIPSPPPRFDAGALTEEDFAL
ncbi:MAG: hypothetical protein LBT12_05355 [Oscillospiraceae bacterium]|nr:hypothetical protein [Oscillospiraceae bacterium]